MFSKSPHLSDKAKKDDHSVPMTGSIASYHGIPMSPDYVASKHGIRGILKAMRNELPKVGIRINMLAQTYIETPLTRGRMDRAKKLGYVFGDIKDVEKAVMRVCDDRSVSGKSKK
jgi:NAD(P)-dependent dehydrogenase (short-subunit alcohol dehydrogenase family)